MSPGARLLPVLGSLVLLGLVAPRAAAQVPEAEEDTVATPVRADTAVRAERPGAEGVRDTMTVATGGFLSAYALLVYDSLSDRLGVMAASNRFSAGSGLTFLEEGTGAAVVLGRMQPQVGTSLLRALREGPASDTALDAMLSEHATGGLQLGAVAPGCVMGARGADDAVPWSGSVADTVGSTCVLAVGSFLPDSVLLRRLVDGFRRADGELPERFLAGMEAVESAGGEVGLTRSAAIWISAPDADRGSFGRARLRIQVEDVQRPAAALRHLLQTGRADDLARRANREVDGEAYRRALELADRAIEIDPATGLAWLARGRALLYLDREDEGETAFQRMLEVNPYLLHLLGDPGPPEVREDVIPYRPRLLLRLDLYRRAFFPDVEFATDPPVSGAGRR